MEKTNKKTKLNKEYYTIGEVAKLLGVHIDTLRRWDKKGQLKSMRLGNNWRRYRKVDLIRLLNLNNEEKHEQ